MEIFSVYLNLKCNFPRLDKFDDKLLKNGFNTPSPAKNDPKRRKRVFSQNSKKDEIVISDEDETSRPIWQQNWYQK